MTKRYSNYKASNDTWLGDIPNHWSCIKLKFRSSTKAGYAFSSDEYLDEGINLIRIGDLDPSGVVKTDNIKKLPIEYQDIFKDYLIFKDSLLMAMTGATTGKLAVYSDDNPALLNQRVCKFIPKENLDNSFLKYILISIPYLEHIKLFAFGGAQPNISETQLLSFAIALPIQIEEQKMIAFWIDEKVKEIDVLIEKKNQFIERLKEKRTALISQVVTKGLPPVEAKKHGLPENPKMKPSGVGWLGDIPGHWNIQNLRYVSKSVKTGKTPPSDNSEYYDDGDIYWFGPADFAEDIELIDSAKKITKLAVDDNTAPYFHGEQVLLVSIGATLGKVGIFKKPFSSNQQINIITPDKNANATYLAFYLRAFKDLVFNWANTATMPILNQDKAKQLPTIVPPLDEQKVIGQYLQQECDKIKNLILKTENAILLLTEYRSAIITAAVTGKIDVRGTNQ